MKDLSLRAQMVTRRTYNRPLDEAGTVFETWKETVNRVVHHQVWLWERQLGRKLNVIEAAELEELRTLMEERKALLSGRTLWLGGTDTAKAREASQFNCLGEETQFITSTGVKSFAECSDGDTVQVWTHKGRWRTATVRSYGAQQLNVMEFGRGRSTQRVRATANHRWVKPDGSFTDSLAVGDALIPHASDFNSWDWNTAPPLEQLYWCYGMVYGDGTLKNNGTASMLRLCGVKAEFLARFTSMGFGSSTPLSCGGDPFVYTGGYLKTLPDLATDGVPLVRAFVRGYLDADGAKNRNYARDREAGTNSVFSSIQVTGTEGMEFVERVFPVVGVSITSSHPVEGDTNYGPRSADTRRYVINTTAGRASNGKFKLRSATPDTTEVVWCLEVDEDQSFTLPNGIVTGNCAFTHVETVYDVVDVLWLLLQGCGVGFRPIVGTLNGFGKRIPTVNIIRSVRTEKGGNENNVETWNPETKTWTLSLGDSAVAWAKFMGKLLAGKYPADTLVLDFSQIRPAGQRLKGYGWLSSGDAAIAKASKAIVDILNRRAGSLLSRVDILDLVNWLGTVLSSRRSAEIALVEYGEQEWEAFANAKHEYWVKNPQRGQSNNSLLFTSKPSRDEIGRTIDMMIAAGGSEPGFINYENMVRRAPWAKGMNPCAEIMLANKGFCNLVTVNVAAFADDNAGLHRAGYIMGRANYRQTCVNLKDGVLQEAWHLNNEYLRLCGASLTGQAQRPDLMPYDYAALRRTTTHGAYSMAYALGTPVPKNVTTVKPEGTGSKIMDCTEGMHKPLGRYIFNNINFSKHDPIVAVARAAGYKVRESPADKENVLITFPVQYEGVAFTTVNGTEVSVESAVSQLDRYLMLMNNWCDQNVSATISYDASERDAIVDWLDRNWDSYVGVSFLFRADPTKTARDLGYDYLPQEVVTKEVYDAYVATLSPVDLDATNSHNTMNVEECAGGVCPVR